MRWRSLFIVPLIAIVGAIATSTAGPAAASDRFRYMPPCAFWDESGATASASDHAYDVGNGWLVLDISGDGWCPSGNTWLYNGYSLGYDVQPDGNGHFVRRTSIPQSACGHTVYIQVTDYTTNVTYRTTARPICPVGIDGSGSDGSPASG